MSLRHLSVAALALAFASLLACERKEPGQSTPVSRDKGRNSAMAPGDSRGDQEFVETAAKANLAEIAAGRMAATKGSDAGVKSFGQQMVDNHSQANTKLTALALKKSFRVPTEADDEARHAAAKLAVLSGVDFDQKYAAMMVADHEKAVALFERSAKDAKDADVRDFAGKTLPTLQHHLQMARDLKSKVGESTAD